MPIAPKKSLGQHFLVDPNIARKIVTAVGAGPEDRVVEIGPGLGALTGFLIERFDAFVAIEVDARAVSHLSAKYPGVSIRQADVLDVDWPQIRAGSSGRLFVVGNLPYNISSPILFSLFEAAEHIEEAVLMLQLEVAERLIAVPRTKQYGILSVAAQLVSTPDLLFRVSRNVFRPRPEVTSAVVRLRFEAGVRIEYNGILRRVVRAAFNQRRKTLRNSLKMVTEELGTEVPGRWASKRAEELGPQEFVQLTSYLTR